jgi:hypothetical protein
MTLIPLMYYYRFPNIYHSLFPYGIRGFEIEDLIAKRRIPLQEICNALEKVPSVRKATYISRSVGDIR